MNRLISIALVCLLQVSLAVASTFNLRVEATPNGAGSLNTSGGTYEEGSKVNLRTSGHTGYVFKGWYEGETLLSSATSFNYTMPSNDTVVQARYEYDPAVPGNPAMPDTTTYYSFTATVSPVGGGTLNTYSGRYAAGATVNMQAYVNTGYQFVGWQNDEGETVASSTSFNYTMPRHDAQLTALYVYDPSVPANPDSMGTRYTVTVACKPVGGGTFNTTSVTQGEGNSVRLYAYTNTGYRFLHWENELGEVIATAQNFDYIIPHGNSKVFGIFEFDPTPPANPSKNYWNKELGEVIVDDFATGSLGSAVSQVISGSSANNVAMITVAGVMNNNDFGIANNYKNCMLLDLCRVTGITAVPSYAFDYTNLESVYLPASIEQIGYRAFYECKQLSSLIVYAMTPPALENDVFTGISEGMVVYVPAAAIAQYQDAAGWKNFTLLPIQEDIRTIAIKLPEGTNVKDYAQMWLELTNTKSGQKMHYVMTDRMEYSFANIIRNTSWNVTLRNDRGDVFGRIDNVEVKDEDVTITFASLSKPQNVSLSALTPDGKDVTNQVQVTWTDAQGNYMAQGASLSGLPVGYQVNYRLVLSQELAMQFDTPNAAEYTLADGDNTLICQLQAIKKLTISGKVKDATTGLPLSGAVISASQTFGEKYSKTLNVKTDKNGVFTLDVARVPTSVAFAATDYVSQTMDFSNIEFDGLNEFAVPDVSLKPIVGATISLGFTYTTVEGETQSWYSDYQNVSYALFNVTKNRAVSQFNVQYPQIVLLEEVEDGDVLKLTATSRTQAFHPVEATATIAEQKAEVTFAITELGRIEASFTKNGNTAVVGSLYDSAGKLLKTYNYSEAKLTISNLADGNYTLVSMASSRLFNTIYDLAQLPQTGLTEGTDYVKNTVEMKSGAISTVSIYEVPTLDESKLYYTGSGTSFTVNKPSIVAGNYLTLTGRIDFKPAYATNVSNVQLIVDLPESCQFVENSVMVGNSTSSYTLNGSRITIPMARYTDRVRFCIIPTLGGEYAPSAFVQFDLDGETITQPIGSANYTAKDLSISVPSTVAKTTVPVSGTAIGKSDVEIYDNDVLIGQTTSMANGNWSTTCELNEPYNLSTHSIYAKVTTKAGLELQSETVECQYDMNAIEVKTVTMINTAHPATSLNTCEYATVFDFQNNTTSATSYNYWPSYPDFTFLVDFTNNDPSIVKNVYVNVFTDHNEIKQLKAEYNAKLDKWMGASKFESNNLPINISVVFLAKENMLFDSEELDNEKSNIEESIAYSLSEYNSLKDILYEECEIVFNESKEQFESLLADSTTVWDETYSLLLAQALEIDSIKNIDSSIILSEEIEALSDSIDILKQNFESGFINIISDFYLADTSIFPVAQADSSYIINTSDGFFVISETAISNIDTKDLENEGYQMIKTINGSFIYYLYSENGYAFINMADSTLYKMELIDISSSRNRLGLIDLNFDNLKGCIDGFKMTITAFKLLVNDIKKTRKFDDIYTLFGDQIYIMKTLQDHLECFYDNGINTLEVQLIKIFALFIDELQKEYDNARFLVDFAASENEKYIKLAKEYAKRGEYIKSGEYRRLATEAYENAIQAKGKQKLLEFLLEKVKLLDKITISTLNKLPKSLKAAKAWKTGKNAFGKVVKFIGSPVGTLLQAIPLYLEIDEAVTELTKWNELYIKVKGILPCPGDSIAAYSLYDDVKSSFAWHIAGYGSVVLADAIGMVLDLGTVSWVASLLCDLYSVSVGWYNNVISDSNLKWYNALYSILNCTLRPNPSLPILPPVSPIHDPSGYVFECVASNRLQNVTATIYYKENVEDMYGDLHENIVKWDASEFAQENPLFTDEYGMYAWDVPNGLWQVKFEKEGYETTYSEWLPVPPPQLDVNIAMKQNVQPNVKLARAYEDAVEVEFDKYMMPELLTVENIRVIAPTNSPEEGGVAVEGTIELLNNEASYEGSTETFASKIRFNAAQPFTEEEITLMVSNRVKSYAGIRMQDDYQQTFAIEQEIKQIVSDSLTVIGYGEKATLTVSVLPASASKGKTLNVKTSSPMILCVETEQVIIDNDGKAEITVSGELPGTAALTFSVEGTDKTALTIASVEQRVYTIVTAPTANIASGSVVEKETKIELFCSTEGATIYYTLDGSCPCEDTDARKVYDGTPIVINETTTIKAMAVAPDMTESDVAVFNYVVNGIIGIEDIAINSQIQIYPIPVDDELNITAGGKTIKSVTVSFMNGVLVASSAKPTTKVTLDVSKIPTGIYIIHITTDSGSFSRKILKV